MLLSAHALHKTYPGDDGPIAVLDNLSLSLANGETLALTGESGSGKSTLLHVVGGLEPVDRGEILLDGRDITKLRDVELAELRRDVIGVVFQQFNLIPSLSVIQNLRFHAQLAGRHDQTWTTEVAGRLGLTALLDRFPEQLSGGQQQRVAIGRALAARPKLLLADEPTGNLDEDTADNVMSLLVSLTKEAGTGLLMVTHSPARAAMLDRQLHLSHGALA